jgi:NADPH:quinone reductase-like Zn-dependent oxidoreductase
MKIAYRTKYGSPEVLTIKEVETPSPKDNEILIKVYAATVNRSDYHILTGKPFFMRLFLGLFKPKISTTGTDFAGQIEAIGNAVTTFKTGENIMGFDGGLFGSQSHAQYILVSERKARKMMVNIPGNLRYHEAAACLEGAFYAAAQVNPLRPRRGQKALVYGATGAIGTSYLQFLKYYGVHTTAVCRMENKELVTSLGADRVIDYTTEDFTKDSERYDFVFDAVGKSSFFKCKNLLKKKGGYTSSGGGINILLLMITPLFGGKKVFFAFPKGIVEQLRFIKDLVEKGRFKPVIDRIYPIDKIAEAYRYVASGQKIGNVILKMDASE